MDRKELKREYKEIEPEAGVYQVRNKQNGKVLLVATPNLKTMEGRKGMFGVGTFYNEQLRKDIEQYGTEAFEFEVLEVVEKKKEPGFDAADALKKLEQRLMDQIQPYGEKGYHTKK